MSEENKPVERPYTLRTLNATDIAPMAKVISKIGIDEFTKCFGSENVLKIIRTGDKESMSDMAGLQVVLEMVNIITAHIPDCDKEIFALLAQVSGLKVDVIKAFDLPTITRMVIDFVKKEEFKDFIGVVSELFN